MECGKGDDKVHLERLRRHEDRLQKKMNEVKGQKRRRRRRALLKLKQRIRNKVKEMHFQLASFLAKNFRQILIPPLPVAEFVKREKRKLGKKTVKNMLAWSHYAFRQRLKNTVRRYPSCEVIECYEDYTSKTCGRCGALNETLGGQEVFSCPQEGCGYVAGRDTSAARNILLRYLTRCGSRPLAQ